MFASQVGSTRGKASLAPAPLSSRRVAAQKAPCVVASLAAPEAVQVKESGQPRGNMSQVRPQKPFQA